MDDLKELLKEHEEHKKELANEIQEVLPQMDEWIKQCDREIRCAKIAIAVVLFFVFGVPLILWLLIGR